MVFRARTFTRRKRHRVGEERRIRFCAGALVTDHESR
jgi:hypothetical protein